MYTAIMRFRSSQEIADHDRDRAINRLLGALRMNGQGLGSDFSSSLTDAGYHIFVSIPEINSLTYLHANHYVKAAFTTLTELGMEFHVEIHGEDPDSEPLCQCSQISWMVLFTHYCSIESPLFCGTCRGILPLYRFPPLRDGEFYDVICWQSDYRCCDRLQANCATGERFGTHEMSHFSSSLSVRGREICAQFETLTHIPTYYYLYRYSGRSLKRELRRLCPSCGGRWELEPPACQFIDRKCDTCKLVSHIALNIWH